MCELCDRAEMPRAVVIRMKDGTRLHFPNYSDDVVEIMAIERLIWDAKQKGHDAWQEHHGRRMPAAYYPPPRRPVLGEQDW